MMKEKIEAYILMLIERGKRMEIIHPDYSKNYNPIEAMERALKTEEFKEIYKEIVAKKIKRSKLTEK